MALGVERPLAWLKAGIQAVSGERAVRNALCSEPGFDQPPAAIALGKAAGSMLLGALSALEEKGLTLSAAFGVTKYGHWPAALPDRLRAAGVGAFALLESAHPVPDDASLAAGRALRAWVANLPPDRPVIVLLSGGASSLVECLPEEISLRQWQALNDWLLCSGWAIDRINRVRAAFSLVKGGGLAQWLRPRPTLGLLISDIPGDDPALIGSGPLAPVPWPEDSLRAALPPPWQAWLARFSSGRKASRKPAVHVRLRIVASNRLATEAAAAASGGALREGEPLFCSVETAVARIMAAQGPTLWGGETTVRLPSCHGEGGRNQYLALLMAQALASSSRRGLFISLGTDGTDGPTPWAGAWVDHRTWRQAERRGLRPEKAVANYDPTPLLAALGRTIATGPTGANVMDLMLFMPENAR